MDLWYWSSGVYSEDDAHGSTFVILQLVGSIQYYPCRLCSRHCHNMWNIPNDAKITDYRSVNEPKI